MERTLRLCRFPAKSTRNEFPDLFELMNFFAVLNLYRLISSGLNLSFEKMKPSTTVELLL